jgi:hypothetical protein
LGGGPAGGYGTFAPNEAWLDVRTSVEDPWLSVRAGRQRVRWGDGRLVGDSEWSIRGQSLDALRVQLDFGDVDVELLGALLALPLPVAASAFGSTIGTSSPDPNVAVTGAQLYGIDATWRILPLLGLELSALTRVARDPLPSDLTRGDTHTIDLRVFGEERGFEYAAEGAYQLGQVAGYGVNRDIRAFALAARAAWQTALPWHFRFGARGAYASGDDAGDASATPSDALNRFDPILPTVHEHHAKMDLYAWSNMIEAGGDVSVRPHEMLTVGAGYTFVALAEANDRWSTGYLIPIGADPSEGSQVLGSEIDAWLRVAPWDFLAFDAGYGAFVLAGRAEAILDRAGHAHDGALHYGMLQAELIAP